MKLYLLYFKIIKEWEEFILYTKINFAYVKFSSFAYQIKEKINNKYRRNLLCCCLLYFRAEFRKIHWIALRKIFKRKLKRFKIRKKLFAEQSFRISYWLRLNIFWLLSKTQMDFWNNNEWLVNWLIENKIFAEASRYVNKLETNRKKWPVFII